MRRTHGGYSGRGRHFTSKGRATLTHALKGFQPGEKARLESSPSAKKGRMVFLKFNNRVVEIVKRQGSAYKVRFSDGGKRKFLVVLNVNLRKL